MYIHTNIQCTLTVSEDLDVTDDHLIGVVLRYRTPRVEGLHYPAVVCKNHRGGYMKGRAVALFSLSLALLVLSRSIKETTTKEMQRERERETI